MPRVTHLQTNFTAGEISPKLYGRVDIARYQNGAQKVRDLIPQVYGGVKRRAGSLFVHEVKDSSKRTRLIPFVKDASSAYVLEFGHLYMRVYKDGAIVGAPYEIASPYTEAQLFEMDYTQGADTMFLFHEAVPIYRLVCAGDTAWTLAAATFVETPYDEPGIYPAFQLTPGAVGPVGDSIALAAGSLTGAVQTNTALGWSGGVVTVNLVGHGYVTGEAVAISEATPSGYNRPAVRVTRIDADNFTYPLTANPGAATAAGKSQGYSNPSVFSGAEVGMTVKINGGAVKITSVNAGVVTGTIKQELTGVAPSPQDAWSLHTTAWSAGNGYPRTGTLYEQRLIAAGSPAFPQTVWGSVVGAYLDFTQGTADDDAFSFTIASDIANPIQYVASNRSLVALTSGGEFTIEGGTERPLAPTNARIRSRSNYGCTQVRPVRIRDAELFVQKAARKVRRLSYSFANDDWISPDLSVLAEHMTESGVADMTWQQEPDSIIWMARADGALLSMTMDADQDVTAWAWHEGFGQLDDDGNITALVESLTCVPAADGDQVWLVVRRTINGSAKRYVERLSEATAMDCGITSSGAAATVWGGLTHLEGETVHVVGDGAYLGDFMVSGGAVTLEQEVSAVDIGLYRRARLKLLPPEIQTGMGSSSGNAMRTSEVTARFFETTGCNINGNALAFRATGSGVLDAAPQPFTGVKRIENLGFERGTSDLEFTQEEPMPFHILSVTRKFTSNDG